MIEWYYLIIISALLNAAVFIVQKKLLRVEHALGFSASMAATIGLLSLLIIPFANFSLSIFQIFLVVVYSALLALSYWATAKLFRHGSLSTGSPAYNMLPIIVVVVLAFIFLGENIGAIKYTAIIAMLLASFVMIMQSNKKRDQIQKRSYIITVTVVVLLSGIIDVFLKYSLTYVNIFTFMFFTSVIPPLIIMLLLLRRSIEYRREALSDSKRLILPLIVIGTLTLGYRIFLYSALAVAPVSLAIPLSSAIIVITTVFSGGIFFGEHHIARKTALSAIMLIASYFLVAS
ncbi:MAG: EamA family transporter [Candidatus Micrarchaeales archaeon]|nr:EamA family transporter [Candidatus Micrarchaeales archaeon]